MTGLEIAKNTAIAYYKEHHPDAQCVILAGSFVSGAHTKYSDLDIVVIYKELKQASRQSVIYNNFPVESFIHDPETIEYFFTEVDIKSGSPALQKMISDGILLTSENDTYRKISARANELLAIGPPELTKTELDMLRYRVTDLLDDIREPKNQLELFISASTLFSVSINLYLRGNKQWSGTGKALARQLLIFDESLAKDIEIAYSKLITNNQTDIFIRLIELILDKFGGPLFDGYSLDAGMGWRKPALRE